MKTLKDGVHKASGHIWGTQADPLSELGGQGPTQCRATDYCGGKWNHTRPVSWSLERGHVSSAALIWPQPWTQDFNPGQVLQDKHCSSSGIMWNSSQNPTISTFPTLFVMHNDYCQFYHLVKKKGLYFIQKMFFLTPIQTTTATVRIMDIRTIWLLMCPCKTKQNYNKKVTIALTLIYT